MSGDIGPRWNFTKSGRNGGNWQKVTWVGPTGTEFGVVRNVPNNVSDELIRGTKVRIGLSYESFNRSNTFCNSLV